MKNQIESALRSILEGIDMLRAHFPEKDFTMDGRLVGDIGEMLVSQHYDVTLYDKLVPGHDGETSGGRKVQIKATFKERLTFTSVPEFYLGIKLFKDGTFEEIYNGPGKVIFEHYSHRKGIGQKQLSFPTKLLKALSVKVSASDRIPKKG